MRANSPPEVAQRLAAGLLAFSATHFTDAFAFDERAYRGHIEWLLGFKPAGLFAAGDYVVQQRGPTTIKAFMKTAPGAAKVASAPGNDDGIYTGSILYLPYEGTNCRQILFDNRNGRLTDKGYVDCQNAEAQSGISSPKQWSAARVKVISDGFRDR